MNRGNRKHAYIIQSFFQTAVFKHKRKRSKKANALILLKAIYNIDGNYVAKNLFPFDLKDCFGVELPISKNDRIERIKELTYNKVQALEKKNE